MMKPTIMGGLMGLMMMWMLHGALTGESALGAMALIAFVGAHLALAFVAAVVIWAGTRFSPRLSRMLARVHRPSLSHVGVMLGSAASVAGIIHLSAHGFGGII